MSDAVGINVAFTDLVGSTEMSSRLDSAHVPDRSNTKNVATISAADTMVGKIVPDTFDQTKISPLTTKEDA